LVSCPAIALQLRQQRFCLWSITFGQSCGELLETAENHVEIALLPDHACKATQLQLDLLEPDRVEDFREDPQLGTDSPDGNPELMNGFDRVIRAFTGASSSIREHGARLRQGSERNVTRGEGDRRSLVHAVTLSAGEPFAQGWKCPTGEQRVDNGRCHRRHEDGANSLGSWSQSRSTAPVSHAL
jgi:hypothetical protein